MIKKLICLTLGLSLIGLKAQYMDQRLEAGLGQGINKEYVTFQAGINWEFGWEFNKTFGLGFGLFGHYNQPYNLHKKYMNTKQSLSTSPLDGGLYLCPRINFGDNNIMPYISFNTGVAYMPIFNQLKELKISEFDKPDQEIVDMKARMLSQEKKKDFGLWLQPTIGIQIYDLDISAAYTNYFMKYPFYTIKIGYSYGHYHKLRKQITSRKNLLEQMDREELERLKLEQTKPNKI